MHRRDFLAASALTTLGILADSSPAADNQTNRQVIELRTYHFSSPQQMEAYEQFLQKAAIPAYNRAGSQPVGAFKLLAKDNAPLKLQADPLDLYVILPHASADALLAFESKLAADQQFQTDGKEILTAPKSAPAYTLYETSVLLAFPGFPTVEVPSKADTRVAQLRTYQAPNHERNDKKVVMFNDGGEIAIFKRCGMNGVFFGQAVAGGKLPNVTYMLCFDDEAALKTGWAKFIKDPDWQKLSKDHQYDDTVSTITNLILRPTPGSQI